MVYPENGVYFMNKAGYFYSRLTYNISVLIIFFILIYGLIIPKVSLLSLLIATGLSVFILKHIRFRLSLIMNILILLFFGVSYYFISSFHELVKFNINIIFYIINLPVAYYLGYIVAQYNKQINNVLLYSLLGPILYAVLSVLVYIIINNNLFTDTYIIQNRAVPMLWDSEDTANAPVMGLFLSLGICFLTALFMKFNNWTKILIISLSILSVIANFIIQNRSPLYAGILAFAFSALIYVFYEMNSKKKIIVFSFLVPFLLVILHLITNDNTINLVEIDYFNRYIDMGLDSPRYELWLMGLFGLFMNPFGGAVTDLPYSYVHNFWLDIGWYAGIIPVIFIFFFQVLHVRYCFHLIFKKRNYIFLGIFVSFFVGFMVEPTMIASPTYVTLQAFILSYIKYNQLNQT
jgi:hypothetical protein